MALYDINLDACEGYNLVKDDRGLWTTRPAFFTLLNNGNLPILYAFSATSQSGQVYHYVFSLNTDGNLYCRVYDDNFRGLGDTVLGFVRDPSASVSHAINLNQILISSSGWAATYYCHVGSMPIVAQPVPSIDTDQDTIELFPGHVASFGHDRFVLAYRNQVLINDAGLEPRTFTAANSITVAGQVLDMFTSAAGNFVIITTDRMYQIPSDGLAGSSFQGSIIPLNHYQGLYSRNAVSCRQGSFGLTQTGLTNLADVTGKSKPLTNYKRPRTITEPVGNGLNNDMRTGAVFPFDQGLLVSFGESVPFCVVDLDSGAISWWKENDVSNKVVGVLRAMDGTQIIAFSDRISAVYGDSPNCTFGLACDLPVSGYGSHRVTEIVVTSTGDGVGEVRSVVKNSDITKGSKKATPAAVFGSSDYLWDTAKIYEPEFLSVRAQRAVRLDGIYFEVGITKNLTIQSISVKTDGQAKSRHSTPRPVSGGGM